MTGCPFFNERATFCASARQHVTVANRRSLSCHLPVSRSRRREVDATRKLNTGTPELLVVRNRGSSTTLPTMVMYVSFMSELLSVDPVLMSGGPVLGVLPANRATAASRRLARHLWTTVRPVDRNAGRCRTAMLSAENLAIGGRRGPHHTVEVMTQHCGGTEPTAVSHFLDRLVPGFE